MKDLASASAPTGIGVLHTVLLILIVLSALAWVQGAWAGPPTDQLRDGVERVVKVEDVVGDLVDRGVALGDLGIAPQFWVREDFDHPFDPIAELIGGMRGPRALNPGERGEHNQNQQEPG